jgi:arylsulfatase A-like enzyme
MLTGRYASRYGLGAGVIFPHFIDHDTIELPQSPDHGLPSDEETVASVLSEAGYATKHIGKWHLGNESPYRPIDHGFDSYVGLPYSNDMYPSSGEPNMKRWGNIPEKIVDPDHPAPHAMDYDLPELPLYRDGEIVDQPVEQSQLTSTYTEEALDYIEAQGGREEPFFLYLSHNMPHVPLHPSEQFRGRSRAGIYGDVIAEIDWSVGRVLEALEREGLREETLVVFTSDHGAQPNGTGSNGPFRGAKGTVYEGGMRVPGLVSMPGTIPEGVTCSDLVANLDLFATFVSLGEGEMPSDRPIDGVDLSQLLLDPSGEDTPRSRFVYHNQQGEVGAVRDSDGWKLHLPSGDLYHLHTDFGETHDRSGEEPAVVDRLRQYAYDARAAIAADEMIPSS